ncbi:hypothetical protein [Streptomyces sp. bgisy153]|uniref:hypothetical protein n=1 Tax=Streptomyces sp. bgisy153 TaxID=3413793 RepID=UPI003D758893
MKKRLRRGVVPVLLGAASLLLVAGCGPEDEADTGAAGRPSSAAAGDASTTPEATSPVSPSGSSSRPGSSSLSGAPSSSARPSPSVSAPASASPTRPAWPRVTFARLSFETPPGWTLTRSGEHGACLQPVSRAGLPKVFGCAGIAVLTGSIPGNELSPYEARQPGGWYAATDVQPCPVGGLRADGSLNGITGGSSSPPVESGLRPVGDRKAAYDRWTATCASGYRFSPQAWYLPVSRVLFLDYTGHPETGRVLGSVRFPG